MSRAGQHHDAELARRGGVPADVEPTDNALMLEGTVTAVARGDLYTVECVAGALRRTVLAKRSGRLNTRHISIVLGDRVQVAVSPYDLNCGRITRRL
jgi:translation initiation factor IF-1